MSVGKKSLGNFLGILFENCPWTPTKIQFLTWFDPLWNKNSTILIIFFIFYLQIQHFLACCLIFFLPFSSKIVEQNQEKIVSTIRFVLISKEAKIFEAPHCVCINTKLSKQSENRNYNSHCICTEILSSAGTTRSDMSKLISISTVQIEWNIRSWWQFFFLISNQMDSYSVQNPKENCHHDHIPFILKGKGNPIVWRDIYCGRPSHAKEVLSRNTHR